MCKICSLKNIHGIVLLILYLFCFSTQDIKASMLDRRQFYKDVSIISYKSVRSLNYNTGTTRVVKDYSGALLYLGEGIYIQLDDKSDYIVTTYTGSYSGTSSEGYINMYQNGTMNIYTTSTMSKYISSFSVLFYGLSDGATLKELNTNVIHDLSSGEATLTWTINNYSGTIENTAKSYATVEKISIITQDVPSVSIDNIIYKLRMDTKKWTVYDASSFNMSSCIIQPFLPYEDKNYPVESIEKSVFKNKTQIKDIYIPTSIIFFGSDAFSGCSNLNVHIENLSSWCESTFETSASNPLVNEGCLYIDNNIITHLEFSENITYISSYSFAGCSSLKSILLSNAIQSIGQSAFANCINLKTIYNSNEIPIEINNNTFGETTYNGELIVPGECMSLYKSKAGWKQFWKVSALEGNDCDFEIDGIYYNILDLTNRTCEVTYHNKYYHSYLQGEINIPSIVNYKGRTFSVIGISSNAFNGAKNLESLFLPQTLEFIGENAFSNCAAMKKVQLSNTIKTNLFDFSSLELTSVIFIGENSTIPNWLMNNTTLKTITFDCPNLIQIPDSAFYACEALEDIILPNTIQTIGNYSFWGCSRIYKIELPTSLTKIGQSAFQSCTSLTSVNIKAPMSEIPPYCYANCSSLTSVVFGDNIKVIGSNAFSYCSAITDLVITSSIDSIADNAFVGCSAVKSLSINDSQEPIKLGRNVTSNIGIGLFSDFPLKEVYIGRNIIAETPFDKNKSIEKIIVGDQVTTFPDRTLGEMPQLSYLALGNKLEEIPSFSTCINLSEIEFGSHIKHLPDFSECLSIRKIKVKSAKPQSIETDFANKVYIDCELFIPKGSISYYQEANIWKNFFSINEYEAENKATSLVFDQVHINTYPGETITLSPVISPLDANEVFIWESSNESIAIVNAFGEVTVKNVGEVIITATTTDGSNITAVCNINVKQVKPVDEIKLEQSSYVVTINEDVKIIAEVSPLDATYKSIQWKSSDTEIATISKDGIAHGNKVGVCSITAKTTDGTNIFTSCKLEVMPVFITDLKIISSSDNLIEGSSMQLISQYEPANATITKILWEVSDSTIAKIDGTGLLTAITAGDVLVTATATDGSTVFAEKLIEVLPIVSSNITAETNQSSGMIDLKWSALNYVKEIKDYNVYVSEDNAPYVLWMPNTTKTSASYNGKLGKSYRFTVTMRDKDGHVEKYNEKKCVIVNK